MKHVNPHLMTLLFTCFLITISCLQKKSTGNLTASDIFVGSTPCDSLVKSLLKIPSHTKCDFIKWDLNFRKSGSNTFNLTALYGESQPNTNGFIGGGTKIVVKGTINHGDGANPKTKVYSLHAEEFQSSIILIEMDSNILHFANANKNFMVGNAGFGYVLNRIK